MSCNVVNVQLYSVSRGHPRPVLLRTSAALRLHPPQVNVTHIDVMFLWCKQYPRVLWPISIFSCTFEKDARCIGEVDVEWGKAQVTQNLYSLLSTLQSISFCVNFYIIMVNKIEITLTFSYIFLSTTERVLYNAKYPQSSVLLPQSSQSETSLQLMVTPSLLCLSASICHGSLASEPAAIVGRFTDAIMINA